MVSDISQHTNAKNNEIHGGKHMKKITVVIIITLLLVSVMNAFVFAEEPCVFGINERYRAAWNVKFEIPADTVIDDALVGYDLLNMPAIKAGAAFIHENPSKEGEWEWNIEDYGGYLLFCEENGDVIHVCLYKDGNGNDILDLMYKYEYGEYPDWLNIALGYGEYKALYDDKEILEIVVTDPCTYQYNIQNEHYVCFETAGGKYLCAVDAKKHYCGESAFEYSFGSYIVTVSEKEYRATVKDYLKYYENWEKTLEPALGGTTYPSFYAAYLYGNPPEVNNSPYVLYAVITVAITVLAIVLSVILAKSAKKRKADSAVDK